MKRKIFACITASALCLSLAACGGGSNSGSSETGGRNSEPAVSDNSDKMSGAISIVSREDGSGTRGAFIELFGIEKKDADGNKVDHTTDKAEITNSTSVMMQTIAGNKLAIGYISLGSLDDSVKALKIDGAEATVDNINNETYKISRPFNIATKDTVSEVTQDFIDFILSKEGQQVITDNKYITVAGETSYTASGKSGEIKIAGSSSVTPVMEKLKEAYTALNPDVKISIQQNDSTTGMESAKSGICDIGMASRALKDSEAAELKATVIAKDGIAVIVNNENPVDELTSEQVMKIYTDELSDWSEVQ